MDNDHLDVETHKFIIPNLRQRTHAHDIRQRSQAGLEVSHFIEHETPSPEVANPPASSFRPEVTASQHASPASDDPGPEAVEFPQRPSRAATSRSRGTFQSSRLSSDDGQLRLRPHQSVSTMTRMHTMKIEDPPPLRPPSEGMMSRRFIRDNPLRFWLLVLIAVLLATAIAVGVGVGVTKGNESCAPSQPSSSGTPTKPVAGVTSPAPINQYCPNDNDTVIIPYDASGSPIVFNLEQPMAFRMLCNTYWPARGRGNLSLRDILVVYTPDMYTCIGLCAAYNSGYSDAVGDDVYVGGGICVAVALIKGPAQFCHLQNATGVNDTRAAFGNPVDTAVLVGDWVDMDSDNQTLAFGGNLPDPTPTSGSEEE